MTRKPILIVVAAGLVIAVVAFAPEPPGRGAARAAGSGPDAAQVFGALRRGAGAADVPSAAVGILARNHPELAAPASRRAAAPDGTLDVRVVPGVAHVCLLVDAAPGEGFAGFGCARWADALAAGLDVTLAGPPQHGGGTVLLAGLVPDGTTAVLRSPAGRTSPLAVGDNVYAADAPVGSVVVTTGPAGEREHPLLEPGGDG